MKKILALFITAAMTTGAANAASVLATEGFVRSGLDTKVDKSALAAAIAAAIPTETDPTVPAWAKAGQKPAYTWAEITEKPAIPDDTNMVHKTGDETIAGEKTFLNPIHADEIGVNYLSTAAGIPMMYLESEVVQLYKPMDIAGNILTGLTTPNAATDAVNKGYVDNNFIKTTGGTVTGVLNVPTPTLP